MKKVILKTLMSAAAISLATVSAFAEGACFERHYDAAHLGNHPDQLVTSMTLLLDPDGPAARGAPSSDAIKIPFDFKIAMTKRGNNNLYVQEGHVENKDGRYRGVVECDGGGFMLQKSLSGAVLSIERIRMTVPIAPEPCGESDRISVDIEKGKDDRIFHLDVVSIKVCSRLFDEISWDAVGRANQ